jgi:hypothetical protein
MQIVKILGGLGNQMFQYALYLSLKESFPFETVKVDCSCFNGYPLHNRLELTDIFDITLPQASFRELISVTWPLYHYRLWQIGKRILPKRKSQCFEKQDFLFENILMDVSENRYFDGYWQNELYFSKCELAVRKAYRFKNCLDSRNSKLLNTIKSSNNSVSIHIRRGDYLKNTLCRNICKTDYYFNAINYINDRIEYPAFYIFSDDIPWCKVYLSNILKSDITFIDWNKGKDAYKDMQLMSECKHNIIANSSFSWWGAWLNTNSNKIIITPQKWLNTDLRTNNPGGNNWVFF